MIHWNYEEIDDRYLQILNKAGIAAEIRHVSDSSPLQQIVMEQDKAVILLNTKMIEEYYEENQVSYESYLAYNVRTVVLPKLDLKSARLRIRRYQDKDAPELFEFASDRESCYLDGSQTFSEMNEEYWSLMDEFKNDETRYVIALKENNRAIGVINVMERDDRAVECFELGYSINPSQRRKGYAFEAVGLLSEFLLDDLRMNLLTASVIEENEPSLNLVKKLGFVYEGKRHKAFYHAVKGPIDCMSFYKERESGGQI